MNGRFFLYEIVYNKKCTMCEFLLRRGVIIHMDMVFRFSVYTLVGLTLEMVFSTTLLDFVMGVKIRRRVPKKYMEGFVSLYMIPLHGFGMLYGFETAFSLIENLPWILRYIIWAVSFMAAEAGYGILLKWIFGFYPWDYYAESNFKILKNGYSLLTLLPFWGLYGILCEKLTAFLQDVSIVIKN